jgi:hypothetical protein
MPFLSSTMVLLFVVINNGDPSPLPLLTQSTVECSIHRCRFSTLAVFAATLVDCWLQGTSMALFILLLLCLGEQRDRQCAVLSSTHDCLVVVVVVQQTMVVFLLRPSLCISFSSS